MYDFDKKINRCNTDCYKWDSFESDHVSKDTLPMFIADMDFEVLPEIKEALEKRVAQSVYGYTLVNDRYYNAVIDWMKRRHHWEIQKDWIITLPGVVPGINASIQAFTEPGDAIIIQPPVYFPFKNSILSNGRKCVESPLINDEGKYRIDFVDFERKIEDYNVRMFILCNPHNPVGRVWTRHELEKLTSICMKHHVLIVSDEIHHDFVFAPNVHVPTASISDMVANYTITCTAPSKTFNLAGLQASNIVIKNPRLKEAFEKVLSNIGLHGINMMGAESTIAAYTYGDAWVDELLSYIKGNMDLAEGFLMSKLPMIKMSHPDGLYLAWIDFRALNMTDEELKRFLIEKAKVWPNAGEWFGEEGSGFARINFACPKSQIQQFLDQLYEAIMSL